VPRQKDHYYTRESTCSRRTTSSGCTTTDYEPCEVKPPH
jgi:hypothetical protein